MSSKWRWWVALLILPLLAAPALTEAEKGAKAVMSKDITLKSGDEQIKAFLAQPEGAGPFPAIVVIQEWWGLNDNIRANAARLAAKGYVTLAPDLYHGKVTEDMKEASQLVKGLPKDRALRDLKAAVDKLTSMKNVMKDRIGSIGWCMGGGYSLQLALHDNRVKACVMCYGRVVTDPKELEPLTAQVLGLFGEQDKGIPAKDVRAFEAALKKDNKTAYIHIYPDAGHGFMRPSNSATAPNPAYNEKDTKDAWQRIDSFYAKVLGR